MVTAISDFFTQDDVFIHWHTHLEDIGAPPFTVTLPSGQDLLSTLRYLEIPEEDVPHVLRLAPSPSSNPELWWFLERAVHSLVRYMGEVPGPPRFAPLTGANHPEYRFFYVHVFIAALPHVQQYFTRRGIPETVVQATVADLGRNVRVYRKRTGQGGLGVAWWLTLHFRGMIYQLGRLQFERARLGDRAARQASRVGLKFRADDHVLSIHIPDFLGPMTPEACDASIAEAHTIFSTYFPDEPVVAGVCNSWLLDPQLGNYLREDSNIRRFQDRFQILPGAYNVNESIVQFVFGPTAEDLDVLPQRSSLERAVVAHLRTGKNWEGRTGWFPW
jgi:hypothetical protein